ncbi:MAG: DUF433 domain-containing protein [Gemmatales bacterium]
MSTTINTLAAPDAVAGTHIVSTIDTCNGQPRINGTRIRVWDVYWWYEREGMSVDQIIADYPQLSPAAIHAAMTFYWDHREELHQHHDASRKLVEEHQRKNPSVVQARIEKLHGTKSQVSS